MIHIHRARKIQRGKGLNLGKGRSKRGSLEAGEHPGGGDQRQLQVQGRGLSGSTDQEASHAGVTVEATLSWPRLATALKHKLLSRFPPRKFVSMMMHHMKSAVSPGMFSQPHSRETTSSL